MRYLLVAICLLGCAPLAPVADSEVAERPAVSVALGVAAVVTPVAVETGECNTCGGKGWYGDGNPWRQCQECNADGKKPKPQGELAEAEDCANLHSLDDLWVSEAEAKASGKTILYFVTLSKGCAPCAKLKGLMDNPASLEALGRFACVKLVDTPADHPWMRHYGVRTCPSMVFVREGVPTVIQTGSPPGVPALLQFLDAMEKRFNGEPLPTVGDSKRDPSKVYIPFIKKPTLAPAAHDTVAPIRPKGRLVAGPQERSCVTGFCNGRKCSPKAPGFFGQAFFRPGMGGRR